MKETAEFWDANPCGIHEAYEKQSSFRYINEPWVWEVLRWITLRNHGRSILEVGCGQGIDSVELSNNMEYTGIDCSPKSIEVAQRNASHLGLSGKYLVGDAENLGFESESFDVVYSNGVLHHTENEQKAIAEIRRVLKPGGSIYIALYASSSPKVFTAIFLRKIQSILDKIFGAEKIIYQFIRKYGTYFGPFGTMFHECFGVPHLKAYSYEQISKLFAQFSSVTILRYGSNWGRYTGDACQTQYGPYWVITGVK